MKKTCNQFICGLLILILSIGFITIPVVADQEIKVQLNGDVLTFDVPPQLINDRTMVPMRKIFEALGAIVEWREETQVIVATKGDTVIQLKIDSTLMIKNGQIITLDVPPMIVSDRTLVPVRAVAESFDADVTWNEDTQTVMISKKDQPSATPTATPTPTPTATPTPTPAASPAVTPKNAPWIDQTGLLKDPNLNGFVFTTAKTTGATTEDKLIIAAFKSYYTSCIAGKIDTTQNAIANNVHPNSPQMVDTMMYSQLINKLKIEIAIVDCKIEGIGNTGSDINAAVIALTYKTATGNAEYTDHLLMVKDNASWKYYGSLGLMRIII